MSLKRKGQEEMVGFVLIVVIVAIVLVVLLGIFLRSPKQANESIEVKQFLGSMMEFTTGCAIGYAPAYANLGELIGDCYDGKTCVNGKDACFVLNKTMSEVIENSFGISREAYYNGFRMNVMFNGTTEEREIMALSKGNCSSYRGADYFFSHKGGTIDILLKLCTGQ